MIRFQPLGVRDGLLLGLTLVAGAVDAVSYLGLGRVFTANMTGNLVLLGLAVGQGQVLEALRSVVAFLGFAAGAGLGGWVVGGAGQGGEHWPSKVTVVLGVEFVLLLGFLVAWLLAGQEPSNGVLEVLTALSAAAMGVQSAAGRRLAVAGVSTTYVTGTLVTLMAELAALARRQPGAGRWVGVLVALLVGATLGTTLMQQIRPAAPGLPVLVLGGIVVVAAAAFPPHPKYHVDLADPRSTHS
jgi:uncharacterized membrane protein YoaK (UPF0700 family)